jgi:predicted sugar kinase
LAAHIDPNGSLGDIVQGIGEKLPKPNVSVKGNQNSTVIGNGQAAQRQTINAANGIGTIGGTLINPQVCRISCDWTHLIS